MITKEQEYISFVKTWRSKPLSSRDQTVKEAASWFQESDKKIDRYFFDEDEDGDLISGPGFKVKKSIRRHTSLGQAEDQAFDTLDTARKNGEELFFWICPPHPDRGPNLKAIITELVVHKGRKRWLNRSLLLGSDQEKNLKFVNCLTELSQNKPTVTALEDIRKTVLIFNPNLDWINALAEAADNPLLAETIKSGQDVVDQQAALEKADKFYDEVLGVPTVKLTVQPPRMMIKKYEIGNNPTPCPLEEVVGQTEDAFPLVYGNAMPIEVPANTANSCPEIQCRGCKWKPNSQQLQLLQAGKITRCPRCRRAP
ncbi:MAG: hypothetical protein Q7R49_06405 [Candidatus Daviesbacteria bacterium]|nr:hypothetical protein [Candidatus Daviesbacteria bacterium]